MTELADLSGVSRATLYRLADTGDLPARKVGGSWRISVADYRAWVASEAGR
ncbi:MAG: helix-turn-helix domain-containing protein [Chloroflexi bacterium]|nr:helix-turn-helix domain-containing protein [Chloroflexota bacterium]